MIINLHNPQHQPRRSAFTLIEMLVVVAIILLLATVGTVSVMSFLDNARRDTAKIRAKELETAVQAYKAHFGNYPDSLAVMTQPGPGGEAPSLTQASLLDPWNNPYNYSPNNTDPTGVPLIFSNGPPGQNSAPIYSRQPN